MPEVLSPAPVETCALLSFSLKLLLASFSNGVCAGQVGLSLYQKQERIKKLNLPRGNTSKFMNAL